MTGARYVPKREQNPSLQGFQSLRLFPPPSPPQGEACGKKMFNLLSFAQFLDAYRILTMLSYPTDTQKSAPTT